MNKHICLLSKKDVFSELITSEGGLSSQEADLRLEKNGKNKLRELKPISIFSILVDQFRSVLVVILMAAVVVSALLGEVVDALAITVIVVLNAVLGFVQDYKAEKAIDALKSLVTQSAVVYRDGKKKIVSAEDLVVGDVIWLESGDKVPADARVISSSELYIDEAPLTGESTPVHKLSTTLSNPGRDNYVFMGTRVMRGSCKAVIFSAGMDTEIGRIAKLVQSVEQEQTPLQKKLDSFGKQLGGIALLICAFMFVAGHIRGGSWLDMFLTAVSLAVAAIPEGLPAVVTISLAVGVRQMVKKNAIIRKLSAVETLGSTSVICTDKTGTLTLNEMTVSRLYTNGKLIRVTGAGYKPEGEFNYHDRKIPKSEIEMLLSIGALCNDSNLEHEKGGWNIMGDSTEGALVVAAEKAGMNVETLRKTRKKIDEFPFDSVRKRMSVVRAVGAKNIAYVKGAPEIILSSCNRIYENGTVRKLTQNDKQAILKENKLMAQDALRVLGMAYKEVRGKRVDSSEAVENKLIFVGLQGMIDLPRPEVKNALKVCKRAGIRVVMVTGDHKITAIAVGRELGLLHSDEMAVDGDELDRMSDEELSKRVEDIAIYARVMPEQKLRIINAWRAHGKVVAMTGDGVNDAPALKQADIGVAMGITGTDVSKEASDMVLADDNFTSIVAAVKAGRGIYENILKFLRQMLGTNLGELLTMFGTIIFNMPLPLVPIQILWMNLLTDGLPVVMLSIDPIDADIMSRAPRSKQEPIMSPGMKRSIIITGLYICLWSLFVFQSELKNGLPYARTVAFTTLVFFQMFRILSVRSVDKTLFEIGVFGNPQLILAVISSIVLQLVAVYLPHLQPIFGTVPIVSVDLLKIIAITSTIFILSESYKIFRRQVHVEGLI